jgi:hypothetical protein
MSYATSIRNYQTPAPNMAAHPQNTNNTFPADPKTPVHHDHDHRNPSSKQTITHDSLRPRPHPSMEPVDVVHSMSGIRVAVHEQENEEFPDYPVDDVDIYHAMDTIEYELNAHNYANNEIRVSPTNDAKKLRQ